METSTPARILVVDDDSAVRRVLQSTLAYEGHVVESAENGLHAVKMARQHPYDLILLDLCMQPLNGIDTLKALHQECSDTVFVILTAHGTIESAIEALRLGAFDYMIKPSTAEAIRARVGEGLAERQRALARQRMLGHIETIRHTLSVLEEEQLSSALTPEPGRIMRSGSLTIDRHQRIAMDGDRVLDLTTTEYNLLVCLVEASPKPVSHRELVNKALGYDLGEVEAREAAKWHVHRLRLKTERDPARPQHLKTVRYRGYFWSG
jgi:DNA-binding response OmpR family regulator